MSRFDEDEVITAILTAPGWARVGLSMPNPELRMRAASELARSILNGSRERHANQLNLPI